MAPAAGRAHRPNQGKPCFQCRYFRCARTPTLAARAHMARPSRTTPMTPAKSRKKLIEVALPLDARPGRKAYRSSLPQDQDHPRHAGRAARSETLPRSLSGLNAWGLVASYACCSPMLPTRFSPFSPASALAKCSFGLDAWASRLRSNRPAPAKLRFRRLESGTEGETRSLRHRKSPGKP